MRRRAVRVSLQAIQVALLLDGGELTDAFQDSQDRQEDTVSLILRSPGKSDPQASSVQYVPFSPTVLEDEAPPPRSWWQRIVDWWTW